MAKELSIESIKKGLMDKLINNLDILRYLNIEKYLKEGMKISDLYNQLIFDYGVSSTVGDYISVEVAEYECPDGDVNSKKTYEVAIKMGLQHKEDLDNLASVIKKIILEVYPDRKKFSNIPVYTRYDGDGHNYNVLNRMITFEMEEKICPLRENHSFARF